MSYDHITSFEVTHNDVYVNSLEFLWWHQLLMISRQTRHGNCMFSKIMTFLVGAKLSSHNSKALVTRQFGNHMSIWQKCVPQENIWCYNHGFNIHAKHGRMWSNVWGYYRKSNPNDVACHKAQKTHQCSLWWIQMAKAHILIMMLLKQQCIWVLFIITATKKYDIWIDKPIFRDSWSVVGRIRFNLQYINQSVKSTCL